MPVLEAMAAGLAVVASDADALREVPGGCALIVRSRVPGAWAQALGRVLADARFARHLRKRSGDGRRVHLGLLSRAHPGLADARGQERWRDGG